MDFIANYKNLLETAGHNLSSLNSFCLQIGPSFGKTAVKISQFWQIKTKTNYSNLKALQFSIRETYIFLLDDL